MTEPNPRDRARPDGSVLFLALAGVALELLTGLRYGIFRDELYYLDCANHLGWGYVDQPPFSIALLAGWRALFGDGLLAIRVPPALALGALIILTAGLARDLGAGRYGRFLAAAGALACPVFLAFGSFYSMNPFDALFWVIALRIFARILERDADAGDAVAGGAGSAGGSGSADGSGASHGTPRLWLLLGLVMGLGLMNKISVLYFAVALLLALLAAPARRQLATRWPWLGVAIAAALFLPHLIWQIAHGWPTVEFVLNAKRHKIAALGFGGFASHQLLEMGPLNWLMYAPGLLWLLLARSAARWRALGWLFVAAFLILSLQRSKPYYLAPAYPALLAGGGCAIESWTRSGFWLRRGWRSVRPRLALILLAGGVMTGPLVIPALSPERLIAYLRAIGIKPPAEERGRQAELPQLLADRFGWQELADAVASTWRSLPEADRARAGIVARNYGEAGAINYFGRKLGLPRAASGHNSYWLWGPPAHTDVIVAVGFDLEDLQKSFASVKPAVRRVSRWAMPYESDLTVYVCRDWKVPPEEGWRGTRLFI